MIAADAVLGRARSFSRQSGSSARSRGTRSPTRRVRHEQRGEALLGERIDRVERLGRRARRELDELARLLEPDAARPRARAASRRSPAATRSAANSRFGDSRRWTNAAAIGPSTKSSARCEPAADAARLDERRGEHDDRRLHEHVAVADVRELVREHALELGRRQRRRASPVLTASAEPRGPRPADERARVAVRQQVEPRLRRRRRAQRAARPSSAAPGASPTGSSRAPTIPSTTGRRTSTRPPPTSSPQKTKIDSSR